MSNEVSLRRDRTFLARTPVAEKTRSTSTDVAGMVSKYANTEQTGPFFTKEIFPNTFAFEFSILCGS